ncbi:lipopolysaccharide biosynthesis protein [Dolichospermum sp. UHCC 0684]|uniref:lipopolysaccharide biosynthesis protein n=1 Tax=unclassified Dolichospermum TaxID=2622029 RepID=UPI0014461A0A|nr:MULTISPECIES: lipopolysaccharide biosynthesis protein [unclassified Dolichospermum]MEA5529739.1 lipopolysaccharide biosynthesis protein [Dolichospermum sp. UHCC 0684]MTJ33952.1 lipopolysaccharide biosynthesis protein [Dolichospermum sp. UHCC 0260]
MSLKQKAITSTIWSICQSWGTQFISLIVFSLLARLINPENFGLIALASTFLAFITIFLDQGFSTAIIQRKELEEEHLNTAFWTNIGIAGLMTLITIVLAGEVANFFNQPNLTPVIRWLSLSFLIGSLNSVQTAIFQRKLDFKPLAIRSLIATLTGGVVGISMALMGCGVWSLVGQQLTNGLIQAIVIWWASDWRPKLSFSERHFRDLFSFGINIIGINILGFLVTRSDNILIGYFLGPVALGYYDLAYRLFMVVTGLFVGVITSTAMPIFSSIQEDLPRLRNTLYNLVELSNTIAFPVFLGMSALAPELIVVIFGKHWEASIPVFQILNIAGLLYGGFYFNAPLMMAMAKPDWKLKLDIYRTFIYFLAFLIGINWGIIGVSLGFVLSAYLGSSWVTVLLVQKLIKINILTYLSKFFTPLINSLIMFLIILTAKYLLFNNISPNKTSLLILSSLGAVTYIICLYLLSNSYFMKIFQFAKNIIYNIGITPK